MTDAELALTIQRLTIFSTLSAALIGAGFGFLGNWISTRIREREERKRQTLQIGFEMGMKELDNIMKLGTRVGPPLAYVDFNVRVIELIREGRLTPESYRKVIRHRDEVDAAIIVDNLESKHRGGQPK